MKPSEYLQSVKNRLLTDQRISGYQIVREFEGLRKAYIRARLTLVDGGFLEFAEYIETSADNESQITQYSYQWIDAAGKFIRRWDNTPHHPDLENFPHHIHSADGEATPGKPTNISAVLDEVEAISGQLRTD